MEQLDKQILFILEIDRLKTILRQSHLIDFSRRENSAEHSWHIALMSYLLIEHADSEQIDQLKVLKMLLVHDIVEIDAGDSFVYDPQAMAEKVQREKDAATRLFGMLPEEQGQELRTLWEEFEACETAEAHYANAIDHLQPLLQNFNAQGGAWKIHGIRKEQVIQKVKVHFQRASKSLWEYAENLINEAARRGYLQE